MVIFKQKKVPFQWHLRSKVGLETAKKCKKDTCVEVSSSYGIESGK